MDAVPHIRKNTHWPPSTGAARVIPGAVWYDESFISVASSKRLFVELQEGVNWVQHRIKIFGKAIPVRVFLPGMATRAVTMRIRASA